MKIAVCTLFEHDYHFGAAVLVNSLCHAGFAGTVYAGFRGPLPPWAEKQARPLTDGAWEMEVSPQVRLRFLQLETTAHFTNYKPDFLLQVEKLASATSEAGVYCDPDIVINTPWRYVEEWLSCGVALGEDVNSPLSENHPRRIGWRRFFKPAGFDLKFRFTSYVNGGWVGLKWTDRKFLETWRDLLARILEELGGRDIVGIDGGRRLQKSYGFADCFNCTDQDALNAALEACPEIPASILGPQAMGFYAGLAILPHALGPSKPWRRNYLRDALTGVHLRSIDKVFWQHAEAPISAFTPDLARYKRMELAIAGALGRVIRKS
jgi:hypothetical protein